MIIFIKYENIPKRSTRTLNEQNSNKDRKYAKNKNKNRYKPLLILNINVCYYYTIYYRF